MGQIDRAKLVQNTVAVGNRIDQLSEVVDGHGGTLTAHKAELNAHDGKIKVLAARDSDLQSQIEDLSWATDAFRVWAMLPWWKRVFRNPLKVEYAKNTTPSVQ